MSVKHLCIFLAAITCTFSTSAFKFEVQDKGISVSDPVHETLTIQSVLCFLEWEDRFPQSCNLQDVDINTKFDDRMIEVLPGFQVSLLALANASSFPDDPGRTESLGSGIKSLVLDEGKCLKRTWWTLWLFKADYTKNITGGLFCSSHFGVLQFFHAMASEEMMLFDMQKGRFKTAEYTESYADSLAKIIAWAQLNARISVDSNYEVLNEPLYPYFDNLSKDDPVFPIGKYFAIKKEYNYEHRQPFLESLNAATGLPYQIKFIYNNQCSNILGYTNCTTVTDEEARLAALGSLFHLIQDSFSSSHTYRGVFEANESVHARIECLPIRQYSTYKGQDVDKHGQADAGNVSIAESCFAENRIVHDPVLAGAITLWYLTNENNSRDHADLVDYLRRHVFATPYVDTSLAPSACAGNFDPYSGDCKSAL